MYSFVRHRIEFFSQRLILLIVVSSLFLSCESGKTKLVPREKIFAVHQQISEIGKGMNDENRCDSEREITRLLKTVCSNCFDGWGMTSYSFDEKRKGCDRATVAPQCLAEPYWIARSFSNCGDCGITYMAVKKPIDSFGKPFPENLFKSISCESFYEALNKKKKFCGNCLRVNNVD